MTKDPAGEDSPRGPRALSTPKEPSAACYFVNDKTARPGSRVQVGSLLADHPDRLSLEMTFQNPAKAPEAGLTYGSAVDFRRPHPNSLPWPNSNNADHTPCGSETKGRRGMSALPPKADMDKHDRDVRFVPKADSCSATPRMLIRLPLWRTRIVTSGMLSKNVLPAP
jgi:hypothetical protein